MKLGIIILNYNTADDCVNCVDSIFLTLNDISYHIYIVDNCSTDDSFKVLNSKYNNNEYVSILLADKNGGFSYGNNLGIYKAQEDACDYLLISNPDVIYYDNSIESMIESIRKEKKIAVVGPSCKSLDEDESQLFRKPYNTLIYTFSKKPFRYFRFFKFLQSEYYPSNNDKKGLFIFNGMVRGCCFLIETKLFEELELFDDNLFLYCEEWVIAKKMQSKNYLCACDFNSRILHKEASSTNKKGSAFQTFHLYLSSFYYMKIYNKTNYLILFIFYLSNIIAFGIRAIFNKNFRGLQKSFLKKQTGLMFSNRDKKNIKNKIFLKGDDNG